MRTFARIVADVLAEKGSVRILDLGGTAEYWKAYGDLLPKGDIKITTVNLIDSSHEPGIEFIQGDACNIAQIADNAFDIVHSNSVIEHVGEMHDMRAMAKEVHRLAPRYFVQTPNYWFPAEPHARLLFLHWLPEWMQAETVLRRRCGFWRQAKTREEALAIVRSARLLTRSEMKALFPDAKVCVERLMGLPKALIAIK